MKINGTSVRGAFSYSPDVEYEYGDFVISGDSMYICRPNTPNQSVIGVDPKDDLTNYIPYLGGETASLDYSIGYLSGNEDSNLDLYVSSLYLQGIFNNYLNGFDEKGVISDFIDLDDNKITTSEKYIPLVGDNSQGIFDRLLSNRELNNAYLRISRKFISGDQSLGVIASILGDTEKTSDIIFRQYSYYSTEKGGLLVRVQELIDPDQAYVMYRYGVLSSSYSIIESTNFKNSFYSEDNIEKIIDSCLTYVSNKEIEYKKKYESLKNGFRYKSIDEFASGGRHMITLSSRNLPEFVFSADNRCLITVLVSEICNGIKHNNSISFDLFDVYRLDDGDEINYYIDDNCLIIVKSQGEEINLIVSSSRDSSASIEDIYYRYNYES